MIIDEIPFDRSTDLQVILMHLIFGDQIFLETYLIFFEDQTFFGDLIFYKDLIFLETNIFWRLITFWDQIFLEIYYLLGTRYFWRFNIFLGLFPPAQTFLKLGVEWWFTT